LGLRDYEPATGRWTAKDPIGFAAVDGNVYRYALNDPVNASDPTGTGTFKNIVAAIVDTLVVKPLVIAQFAILGPWYALMAPEILKLAGYDPTTLLGKRLGLGIDTQSTAYQVTEVCIGVLEAAAGGVAGAAESGATVLEEVAPKALESAVPKVVPRGGLTVASTRETELAIARNVSNQAMELEAEYAARAAAKAANADQLLLVKTFQNGGGMNANQAASGIAGGVLGLE
jgi:uncharacterized protein RhaS with RHS repeats